MKLGKAADLDGISVVHLLYCHSLLPCVLAKLFNLMMNVGHVPRSFGLSYTVPILKNNNSIYCKCVTVDDFRGISISPLYLKYLNTVSWTALESFSYHAIINLGLRNIISVLMRYTH